MFLHLSLDTAVWMGGQPDGKNPVEMMTPTEPRLVVGTLNTCDEWGAFRGLSLDSSC